MILPPLNKRRFHSAFFYDAATGVSGFDFFPCLWYFNQYSTNPPPGKVPAAIFWELISMVREIIRDEVFLAQKAEPATPEDLPVAQDLLDTLAAHKDGCVGVLI